MRHNIKVIIILISAIALSLIPGVLFHWLSPESIVQNRGFLGGALTESSLSIRLGTHIGYYLNFLVLAVTFWRPFLSLPLPLIWAAALFFSGVTSNFLERLFTGYVTDYIHLPLLASVANVADLLQIAGVILFFSHIFSDSFRKKSKRDRRGQVFSDSQLQLRLFYKISFVFFGFLGSISILFYNVLPELHASSRDLFTVILVYAMLFESVLFCVLISETHRWLGPVRSFIGFMNSKQANSHFQLRLTDEFKELEAIAKRDNV